MKIYLFKFETNRYLSDEYIGFVVVANNKDEVLFVIRQQLPPEQIIEFDEKKFKLINIGIYIGKNKKPFIALDSFVGDLYTKRHVIIL